MGYLLTQKLLVRYLKLGRNTVSDLTSSTGATQLGDRVEDGRELLQKRWARDVFESLFRRGQIGSSYGALKVDSR